MPTKIATGCKFRVGEDLPGRDMRTLRTVKFSRDSRFPSYKKKKSTVDDKVRSFGDTPFSSEEVWKDVTDQVSTERCNFQNCAILDLGPSIIDLEVHTFGRF